MKLSRHQDCEVRVRQEITGTIGRDDFGVSQGAGPRLAIVTRMGWFESDVSIV